MANKNAYEKYLEDVGRYLCDTTKDFEEAALLKRQIEGQRAAAYRNYKKEQNALMEAAQELNARFSEEASAIAALHIDGLSLPARVRPKSTPHGSEELCVRLDELYEEISGLRNEYVASVSEEAAIVRRQSAQKRRDAVLEARNNAEKQYEHRVHIDDSDEAKKGCVGVAAVLLLCALRTSLILIQTAISIVQ